MEWVEFRRDWIHGGLGLSARPIEYRFKTAMQRLAHWLTWPPAAQRPIIMIGVAHTVGEVRQFRDVMKRSRSQVVISTAPSEILRNIDRPGRAQRCWVDSSAYGDFRGGCFDISLETINPETLQSATSGYGMGDAIEYL